MPVLDELEPAVRWLVAIGFVLGAILLALVLVAVSAWLAQLWETRHDRADARRRRRLDVRTWRPR